MSAFAGVNGSYYFDKLLPRLPTYNGEFVY